MESYEKIRSTDLYQAFRSEGYPTHYGENHSNAFFDLEVFSLIFAFFSIGLSLILVLPGFRGKQRLFVAIRCFLTIIIGVFILVCNVEYGWERDSIKTSVRYKSGSGRHINASIGLHIGLRGINITLVGLPKHQIGETIKYNEHYSWEWGQGRAGFGPKSGTFHKQFRNSQYRGTPHPILWIAEYFTFDGEGIRFGRHYRLAGWYSHIMLWLSVPLYLLSNILFQMVIQYGALFLVLTGSSLVTANIIYCTIRNPIPLKIPFEGYMNGSTVFLEPSLSWCYYTNLINGLFCIFLGIIIFLSDLRFPDETAQFFGIDVLQSYEDYFAEIKINPDIERKSKTNQHTLSGIYAGLRKRNLTDRLSRIQKSSIRKKPMTQPRNIISETAVNSSEYRDTTQETPLYENFQRFEAIQESEENQF